MLFGSGFGALLVLGLLAYCVFDIISADESQIQNLPKFVWLLIVIIIPIIGPAAWLLLGRPGSAERLRQAGAGGPGGTGRPGGIGGPRGSGFRIPRGSRQPPIPDPGPAVPPAMSPEDHQAKREETLKRYYEERDAELKSREDEIKRREDELRKRERGEDPPAESG